MRAKILGMYLKSNNAVRVWMEASGEITSQERAALEILASPHVASVKAEYHTTMDDVRFYQTETEEGHRYLVRIQDAYDETERKTFRFGKCQCKAASKEKVCRHLLKTAVFDSEKFNLDLDVTQFLNYKGHVHAQKCAERMAA